LVLLGGIGGIGIGGSKAVRERWEG
jgi:hypothetical protein